MIEPRIRVALWSLFAIIILLVLAFVTAKADDLHPSIKSYPHPLIFMPITETDGVTLIGDKSTWVVLTWAKLERIEKARLVFDTENGLFSVPAVGYICTQA